MVNDLVVCYLCGLATPIPFLFALYIVRACMSYFQAASSFNGD